MVSFNKLKNLYFGCNFSYGLYNFDGKMEDYDWLNMLSSDYTHYSCHNLSLSKDLDFSWNKMSKVQIKYWTDNLQKYFISESLTSKGEE